MPGSAWALLDAVAFRRPAEAVRVLELVLDTTPELVVLAQLHRRIRELIEVADLLASGTTPAGLVRTLKLKPFRAEKLAQMGARWTLPELEAALGGLLELDATIKGADGSAPAAEAEMRIAFTVWIAERVAMRG
jgi:DNA polymerase III delta subunit